MQLNVFQRVITSKILSRLSEERRLIQIISGPRQVGKTTAILQVHITRTNIGWVRAEGYRNDLLVT